MKSSKLRTQREHAYSRLRDLIAEGDIYAVDAELRLREDEMLTNLAVGRPAFRLALTELENEGLVEVRPRRGNFVVRKSKTEICDCLKVWLSLEMMAVRKAFDAGFSIDFRGVLERAEELRLAGAHNSDGVEAFIGFHRALVSLGRCALIDNLIDGLVPHVRPVFLHLVPAMYRDDAFWCNADALVEALMRRETELATQLLRDQMESVCVRARSCPEIPV